MSWWERHSGTLNQEMDALQSSGMQPELDVEAQARGQIAINITLTIHGKECRGRILYPDLYPYFRPVLVVPKLGYNLRHYNPFSGEICLLRRGTQFWQPSMTAATLIREMLPEWENASVRKFEDARLGTEDQQAEPATAYFEGVQSQFVMIDGSWAIPPGITSGKMKVALTENFDKLSSKSKFCAWALELLTEDKKPIAGLRMAEAISSWARGKNSREICVSWTKLNSAPNARSLSELVDIIPVEHLDIYKAIQEDVLRKRSSLHGICFPEESPGGGKRDAWIFLAYHVNLVKHPKKPATYSPLFWLIKAESAGEDDLLKRIPELSPLRNKSIAVIGLGCVGAPSVLALARAGIAELRLLDTDYLSPGTICRWPLGLSFVGRGKVEVLSEIIRANYPLTEVNTSFYPPGAGEDFRLKIGEPAPGIDQMAVVEKMLDGVDLVYDATAEEGINHLLSDVAASKNLPYITVSSRAGGWGGNVVRVQHREDSGCLLCYLYSLEDRQIPQPPYDPEGEELQPVGCGDLTFTAAGFDVEEISLAGVRMAVSTLCEGEGYPPIVHDVGILSLREDGASSFPKWRSFPLLKHPKCLRCNK
ncbi:ThiF family adenylyltransferase [Geomonas paludis]|uniref:ThiF family adenylyltransferase n=1 Tax=Geomonas paludis TaxID=2740185 RepID=A0ABY4LCC3_9BACT|nr:ThiF family adenylyltransferase [Geomonas paludis]UPU34495.1 ThiF family adenylyltransferase [Geomonas paludis]